MNRKLIPVIFIATILCQACARPKTASLPSGPRESLGQIMRVHEESLGGSMPAPSGANLTPAQALLSAQLIAVFLEARYGMSSLEKFKHVEGFYTPRDKGSEWTMRFFKDPSQPGGYFTIRVDDRTGQVTDYSPGD